jgi:cytochrome c-type biogenesis protein CcsB
MNNVMDYQGYRFFQSSYDSDEKGTVLSVNYDWWGTNITYLGYLFMALGMILTLITPTGRFRELNRKLKKSAQRRAEMLSALLFILAFTPAAFSQDMAEHNHDEHDGHNHDHEVIVAPTPEAQEAPARPKITPKLVHMSAEHSDSVATLLIQDYKGRIIPMHTLCDQFLRKISRSNTYEELNAVQTIVSLHMYPDYWIDQPLLYVSSKGDLRTKLKLKKGAKHASFRALTDEKVGNFVLLEDYEDAHRKMEGQRNEYDKQVLKLGEHYQVFAGMMMWHNMKIIPVKGADNNTWYVPLSAEVMALDSVWSQKALKYFSELDNASREGDYAAADKLLSELKNHQYREGGDVTPSRTAVNMEVSYNKMNIFGNTAKLYITFGFLLLILFFVQIFFQPTLKINKRFKRITQVFSVLLFVSFLYHGMGISMRAYITGYAPWSNGYEAVVFIAFMTMLVGFIFSRKHAVILAAAAILGFLMIFVTEMNLMDPEISPMQPVLKSYWLMIHVAIITGSYAPLGLSCILGLITLILYIVRNKNNADRITVNIKEITLISEMVMMIGLFMLTIGTFLGGIWANESWGRYWGWDSKETWALAAVLVYAIILHFRFVPALKSKFTFNLFSFWGYASILFTFFGVNFYLAGLHSYVQGEAGTVPEWLKWVVLALYIFSEWAWIRNKLFELKGGMVSFITLRNKLFVFLGLTLFMSFWIYLFGLAGGWTIFEQATIIFVVIAIVNIAFFLYAVMVRKNSNHQEKLNF